LPGLLSGTVGCRHASDGLVELRSVFDLGPCPEVPVVEEHWLIGWLTCHAGPPLALEQLLCHRLFLLLFKFPAGLAVCVLPRPIWYANTLWRYEKTHIL
jgi:hypothetical protein